VRVGEVNACNTKRKYENQVKVVAPIAAELSSP
jgi:hypothetical protein